MTILDWKSPKKGRKMTVFDSSFFIDFQHFPKVSKKVEKGPIFIDFWRKNTKKHGLKKGVLLFHIFHKKWLFELQKTWFFDQKRVDFDRKLTKTHRFRGGSRGGVPPKRPFYPHFPLKTAKNDVFGPFKKK